MFGCLKSGTTPPMHLPIQFGCKFLGWYHLVTDPEQSLRFLSISEKFRDARSVFRLTKFLFEIKRMQIIYENSEDKFSIIINILSRLFYLFHWLFDNMFIIMKLSDTEFPSFTGITRDALKKLSRKSWLIGISLFLVYCVKILRKTYTDESDLKVAAVNKMTVREVKENLQIMTKLRRDYQMNFARVFSDLVVCVNENDLPFKVLGKRINHGVEGTFGMLAALIYLYGLSKHSVIIHKRGLILICIIGLSNYQSKYHTWTTSLLSLLFLYSLFF